MLDDADSRLLAAIQKNAHLTAQELGEILNLSASQAGRRRQRLEAGGIIQGITHGSIRLNWDWRFRLSSRSSSRPTHPNRPAASPA